MTGTHKANTHSCTQSQIHFRKCRGNPSSSGLGKLELLGVGWVLNTPVLLTLQHVHAIIDSKTFNRIAADFKAQHLDAIAGMLLPGDQQQVPPPPPISLRA